MIYCDETNFIFSLSNLNRMKKLFSFALLFVSVMSFANNVQLTNVSVVNNVSGTGKVIVFDLSWENSWRTSSTNNYDGVWVFFKVKDNDGKWYPLRFTTGNVTMPSGAAYDFGGNPGLPGIGMYIFRATNGFGNINLINIRAGIQSLPGTLEVRGFAIEMVFIPQDNFYAGDGNTGTIYRDSVAATPFLVSSSNVILGNGSGQLYDGLRNNQNTIALINYPTGYHAFWIMKYEVSQGAYRDFLNTLTKDQQITRFQCNPADAVNTLVQTPTSTLFHKSFIRIDTPAVSNSLKPAIVKCNNNDTATYEWHPVTYITWPDAAAYLDWAGLRPMTELEYEKACRGPLNPVQNEYAWGTPDINDWTVFINGGMGHRVQHGFMGMINEFAGNASVILGNGTYGSDLNFGGGFNVAYNNLVRNGAFATPVSTRVSSGAGFYGVMELSGNAEEAVITTANAAGVAFTGKHGDGTLTDEGNANENNWPGVNGATGTASAPGTYNGGAGVRSDGGVILRGGAYSSTFSSLLMTSNRQTLLTGTSTDKFTLLKQSLGIRGVRSN